MLNTLRFFLLKMHFFHNSNVFGSCIIHILYTGCAKIKKKLFRRQKVNVMSVCLYSCLSHLARRAQAPYYTANRDLSGANNFFFTYLVKGTIFGWGESYSIKNVCFDFL